MMGGFRLQMAYELSCGVLYALQSDRSSRVSITIDDSHSGIQDDTAKHGQSDCDDIEIDQTDQLGDDGDMDDEDDADESDEERTADPNFLVPTYENEPDPNDIFALKWAYNKSDPVWKKKSVFFRHIPAIEKCLKADANWPLQHCYDMVLEIFHYLMETESDVKLTASVCTSRINKIIVWPEIITTLIAIKFNVSPERTSTSGEGESEKAKDVTPLMVLQDVFMEHIVITDKLKTTVWSELDKSLKDNLISSVEASLTFNKLLVPSKSKIMKRIKDYYSTRRLTLTKGGSNQATATTPMSEEKLANVGVDIDAENRENAGVPEDSDHDDERITLTTKHLARLPASQSAVADAGNARELDIDQNS
eukprot:Em0011g565a